MWDVGGIATTRTHVIARSLFHETKCAFPPTCVYIYVHVPMSVSVCVRAHSIVPLPIMSLSVSMIISMFMCILFMRIEWAQYCPSWLPTFMREWVNSNGLGARRLRTNFQSMWQLKVTNKKILKIVDGTSGYPKSCSKDPRAYPAASLDRCQRSQLALAVFGRIELT